MTIRLIWVQGFRVFLVSILDLKRKSHINEKRLCPQAYPSVSHAHWYDTSSPFYTNNIQLNLHPFYQLYYFKHPDNNRFRKIVQCHACFLGELSKALENCEETISLLHSEYAKIHFTETYFGLFKLMKNICRGVMSWVRLQETSIWFKLLIKRRKQRGLPKLKAEVWTYVTCPGQKKSLPLI